MSARNETGGDRPRVLILGGGFGGIGAAQKLRKSDVDVVLVDKHDYHTFQPLLYQVATGLLEQPAVGHPIRDLFHGQDNVRVHDDEVTAVDLAAREVRFGELEPLAYDYLVLGLGAEVNFFGVEGADEHSFPLYTLPDAVRLKDHILERWEAVDRKPALAEDGALNVVVVGGGPTGVETAGAIAELYKGVFRKDYPDIAPEPRASSSSRLRPDLRDVQGGPPRVHGGGAGAARGRGDDRRGGRVDRAAAGQAQVGNGPCGPHARLGGRAPGERARPLARPRARAGQPHRGGRRAADPVHPEVFAVGDIAAITDAKTQQILPQLGSVALQSGAHAGETIARLVAGKKTKPFEYRDKGTMATIGRGAAVVQMLGGKTMKGKKAQLAWGTVHLALLPTNQDRAKAVVDWAGAGLTHQRSGRIRVET